VPRLALRPRSRFWTPRDAAVWAEVTDPDQGKFDLKLDHVAPGKWSAAFTTISAGIYTCRVRAEGYSSSGNTFTREKTVTAGVYYGDYNVVSPDCRGGACELLECALSEKFLSERAADRLKGLGVDLTALRECVREHCPATSAERIEGVDMRQTPGRSERRPQAEQAFTLKTAKASKPVKLARAEVRPKKMPDKMQEWPKRIRMFSRPSEPYRETSAEDEKIDGEMEM
jgi:hypothetical protein